MTNRQLELKSLAGSLRAFLENLEVPYVLDEDLRVIKLKSPLQPPVWRLQSCWQALAALVAIVGDALKSNADGSYIKRSAVKKLTLESKLTPTDIENYICSRNPGHLDLDHQAVIYLWISKERLIRGYLPTSPRAQLELIFDPATLKRLLKGETQGLESWWGQHKEDKLIIFVPSWPHFLNGPYLAIVGGDPVAGHAQALTVLPPGANKKVSKIAAGEEYENQRAEEIYENCRDSLNWQEEWLTFLTPLHLKARGNAPDNDPIARLLRFHTVQTSILFLAGRTKNQSPSQESKSRVAIFSGAHGQAEVLLEAKPSPTSPLTEKNVMALVSLVEWAHLERFRGDRLSIAQDVIARKLVGIDKAKGFDALLDRAPNVLEGVRAEWKLFMRGKLDEFMGQVHALETEVTKTVQAFSDQTTALIKSLSETALAAVAVILGTFIAAIVEDGFNPSTLILGVTLYIIYIACFPLYYNMKQQWETFGTLADTFERNRKEFEKQLTRERVEEIVGNRIRLSCRRFRRWWTITLRSYLAVIAVVILAVTIGLLLLPGSRPGKPEDQPPPPTPTAPAPASPPAARGGAPRAG